jgi:hypothetical protein
VELFLILRKNSWNMPEYIWTKQSIWQKPRNIVISSIVGGIAGGILMLLVLMAGAVEMGLNSTAFAQIMGMGLGASMSSAVMVGLAGHFTVSIVAGAIFGIIVSFVKPINS